MLAGFKGGEKNIKALKSGKLLELNMVNMWFHNVSEKQLLKQLFVHVGAPFSSYVPISVAALVPIIDQDTHQLLSSLSLC